MLKLDCLQPVKLRDIWPNETTDFTPWLVKKKIFPSLEKHWVWLLNLRVKS